MSARETDRLARFSHWLGNLVPDATSASVILLAVVVVAALASGNSPATVGDAYYRGLWMLLPFTMQMTLILVLSAVVSATPLFRAAIIRLADLPRTLPQVVALAVGLGAAFSYAYWGLGLALAPLIAIHFSAAAERKGIPVDFPFLLAAVSASLAVWQFGLSSSAALMMATPGHFLETTVGIMSLRSTIWSLPAVLMSVAFPIGVILLTLRLMPRSRDPCRPSTRRARSPRRPTRPTPRQPELEPAGFAAWVERSAAVPSILALALLSWLCHHFFVKGLGLDLNAMNTMLLAGAFLLHRNVAGSPGRCSPPCRSAGRSSCVPPVRRGRGAAAVHERGDEFAGFFASLSTPLTSRSSPRSAAPSWRSSCPRAAASGSCRPTSRPDGRRDRKRGTAGPARGRRWRPRGQFPVALLAGPARRHRARRLPDLLRLRCRLRAALVRAGRSYLHVRAVTAPARPAGQASRGGGMRTPSGSAWCSWRLSHSPAAPPCVARKRRRREPTASIHPISLRRR